MPAHVVANWLGHSVKVQNDSYAQVDDHHFERFNQTVANGGNQDTRNGTKRPIGISRRHQYNGWRAQRVAGGGTGTGGRRGGGD